ncbi:MAG: acylphosphatase [Candidatus Omnitrophica bacterium]|nr:acylphosphatase [Candidatus Omnitrophota bacterium]MDD5488664.1 acylphosphatase [Candidatus Omnitrophota bacterium]
MGNVQRVHFFFFGTVQGVGFRFTALNAAKRSGVSGFVRNLPDGSVEAVCEGTGNQIDAFLGEVTRDMSGYISDYKAREEAVHGKLLEGFRITH